MAIPQVTVADSFGIGYEGQHWPQPGDKIKGFTLEAVVNPGYFTIRGTDPATQANVVSGSETAGTDFLGVVVKDPNKVDTDGDNVANYNVNDMVGVLRAGRIVVTTEDAATAGGQVFVRIVATGAEVLGATRATADASDTVALPLDLARFETSAGAGELAVISINLA